MFPPCLETHYTQLALHLFEIRNLSLQPSQGPALGAVTRWDLWEHVVYRHMAGGDIRSSQWGGERGRKAGAKWCEGKGRGNILKLRRLVIKSASNHRAHGQPQTKSFWLIYAEPTHLHSDSVWLISTNPFLYLSGSYYRNLQSSPFWKTSPFTSIFNKFWDSICA
jgi:hypothetical protein